FFTSNLLRVGNWTPNCGATQNRGDVDGGVIAMSKPECLEAQTLPTLGQAIFDAANAVREMLEQRVEQACDASKRNP
ncbi:hypothetical protein M3O48_21020, partial [Xanthomonas nasturtii]|nr:hypothetical protein [Xanthomonas nasturtii]